MAEEEKNETTEETGAGAPAPEEPAAVDGSAAEEERAAAEEPAPAEDPPAEEEPSVEEPSEEEPAPAEEPEEAAPEEEAAEEAVPEGAPAAEPATQAPAPDAEPEEQLTQKQRRKLERSSFDGEAGPQRSPEERAAERAARRAANAASRSRRRAHERRGHEAGEGTPPAERSPGAKKVRQGTVLSSKADKTITVKIEVVRRHPVYEKVVRRSATVHAHDERNEASEGDVVRVIESRPLSRSKRWRLVEVMERAR